MTTPRIFAAFLSVVAVVAGIEWYALVRHENARTPPVAASAPSPTTPKAPPSAANAPQGDIDVPLGEAIVGPRVSLSGWALAPGGIRAVEVRLDGRVFAARLGVSRPDVAQARPGIPGNATAGYEFTGDFAPYPAPPGADRRTLTIVAVGNDGSEKVLGQRSLIEPAALARWSDFTTPKATPFYLLPALSGIDLGGAAELDTIYAPYQSKSVAAGFRVPILYLRMTKGAAADFVFDPDWDAKRKCGDRRIGDDSLNTVLAHARAKKLPVLVTLNGGIWADAYCDVPEWDINDKLEQVLANNQWNEKNEVMPDNHLKNLPGSQEAPELARSLTFNVYATEVRKYKKRNLQQAGVILAAFARADPALFVGVNLDPDVYLNPFFAEQQWYDYNPDTLKQFRAWLAGTGPYAGRGGPDVPDLRAYRRAKALTLAEVNRLAGAQWKSWNDVDAPRKFVRTPVDGGMPFWKDPWVREWEIFRRHLVHLHYDELAQWLVEAGIDSSRIWSSQGLMAPQRDAMPFAVALDSPPRNYDSGGMSIAGAKPAKGHLGVILYGEAAVNDVPMDDGRSLFATLEAVDPHWAVVEYNTADLRNPDGKPTYAAAYRGMRDLWNFGGRFVSPMAWNGSNGINASQPGYSNFTAWRNTALEDASRDFMLARAGLPLGALLWTFGTPQHADGDGWTADVGRIELLPGELRVHPDANRRVSLLSPSGLPEAARNADELVFGVDGTGLQRVRVQARRDGQGGWITVADASGTGLRETAAGVAVKRIAAGRGMPIERLRIELTFRTTNQRGLTRIAAIPAR